MSHAERCPVCYGDGRLSGHVYGSNPVTCHGCNGSGWVTVHENGWVGEMTIGGDQNNPFPLKRSKK